MLFNSLTFVVFFAVLLAAYYALRSWRCRRSCSWWPATSSTPPGTRPSSSCCGSRPRSTGSRPGACTPRSAAAAGSPCSALSLAANLGLLGFFKYGGFLLENFQNVVGFYGMSFEAAKPDIILPVGISFYTFQTMSYTIDVYRGASRPSRSLPRLRALRDLLPAAGGRPDRARHATSCPSARRRAAPRAQHARLGPVPDDPRPVPEGRARRHHAARRPPRPSSAGAAGRLATPRRLAGRAGLLGPDLLRLRRLLDLRHRRGPAASGSRCRTTSAAPTRRSASPTSGGAGTSRSRPGCATTSTSRWAATAGAGSAPTST